ncbi:hypothetical protein C439_15144 [Haloferax mediterranei ATCC 33500]|nr:hypothetical protein BM92_14175 [Haloferax mediterranei ATCC 33500]ELZ99206.1 hypothetical protein C439_15144 [Haloferax mediterranei ATCC 33500]
MDCRERVEVLPKVVVIAQTVGDSQLAWMAARSRLDDFLHPWTLFDTRVVYVYDGCILRYVAD